MAKMGVDFPREWEGNVTIENKPAPHAEVEPFFVSGSVKAPCLFLTIKGEGGMERRAVVYINGNTGWPELRRIQGQSSPCEFDMPAAEYQSKHGDSDDDDDDVADGSE